MKKRIISFLLVIALIFSALPTGVSAKTSGNLYGDVNGDKTIDLLDALDLKKFISKNETSAFKFVNADLNTDQYADLKDLMILNKYLAEWNIHLGPELLTVSFLDGEDIIDVLPAEMNYPLGEVPKTGKSSKANAILLGYFTDKEFTSPFYSDDPVTGNTDVYAKYQKMGSTEELNLTSFAQMDQSPEISFNIKKVSGNIASSEAVTLAVKDGSDPVMLDISDVDGDGIYTVSAPQGYNEGCSYELTLADGWVFDGKEESIRTAAFSIAMDEVENLQMNDDILYIKDTDTLTYNVGGKTYDVLTSDQVTDDGGTFVYDLASTLKTDDILCIYVGVKPTERDTKKGSELLDPATYVKVSKINGNTVIFAGLDENDQYELYNTPDNFPITVSALPSATTGTVNLENLDRDMYANMMGDTDGTYEKALEAISVGDFVTLYVSKDNITSESDLFYGEITSYNKQTKEITYKKTTKKAIEDSMDLYSELSVAGSDIVTPEEQEQLQSVLLTQVQQSNFAEEAAHYLCDMVTKTDGFRNNMTVKDYLLSDKEGNPLSDDQIKLLNIGGNFELSDDIELKVELITRGDQLHYKDGVQLAIQVKAEFKVDVEDDGQIVINLSATFVEEVELSPRIKGSLVTKEILFIPVPIGVSVNASVDIKNYTAFSFAAEIYTVEKEDASTWDKVKNIAKDPTKALGLAGLPSGLKDGLKSIGDVMDKIEELKEKVDKATDTAEKIKGYKKDIDALWEVMAQNGTTKEEWNAMCDTLGKTSVASDLLGLMNMSTDTEIQAEFLDNMQALMDKYTEMLEKETDWVTLVDKDIMAVEVNILGIAIGVEAKFVVRGDLSIAIGSNLEYEVGKRFSFWFKIGLFKPSAGSSTMDLLDEHFAFQFYVMGKLGLKAGVRAKLYVGIGSGKLASVGITAEMGPYIKLYGFFVYEYTKYRPANTQNWTSKERMAGALYLDFGLYFMLGFEANALGDLFEYSHDFLDEEVSLLTAGNRRYYYNTAYEPSEDEKLIIRDKDDDSSNGITMPTPESVIALSYVDLDTGMQGTESLSFDKYKITLSNRNFHIDEKTGVISVTVPENIRYMESDMTITYVYGKIAFSQYDMSVTVPLVWTNLSTEELNEYYTASVRVGNDTDGYQAVWSKKVLKNQAFNLPDDNEIKKLMGWNDYKYTASTGYNGQPTEGLTLIEDKVYDYKVNYKTYSLKVNGIQNPDGTEKNQTFTAKYGEAFDFSSLSSTGTTKSGTYNKFAGVTTKATITVNGEKQIIDLTQPINSKVAQALTAGVTATANYVDDSTTATFVFNGIDHDNVTVKVKKGTVPTYDYISVVEASGSDVVGITPAIAKISTATTYYVDCKVVVKKLVTITFDSKGGSIVAPLTRKEGTVLPALDTPTKTGYTFEGWYTDIACTNKFTSTTVPESDLTLFAKWNANTYTITFNVNGGNELSDADKTKDVTYDGTYGTLPTPSKSGYGFVGWYTEAQGGTQVKPAHTVSITGNKTIYAHWKQLKNIPRSVFDFGKMESYTYTTATFRQPTYVFTAENNETYTASEFNFRYKIQGESDYIEGLPVQGGTYDVLVTRAADNDYARFEQLYSGVLTINYITFDVNASWYNMEIEERVGTGSNHTLDVEIVWSDGKSSTGNMAIDKDWNTKYFSRYGVYPTQFKGQGQGTAGLDRTMTLNVNVYDILGKSKTLYSSDKYWSAKDPSFDVTFSGLPAANTSANGINVDSCSKIIVNLTTYGVNGALSGVKYIVDNNAVTVNGDKLLIDGGKLTGTNNTITVRAQYPGGDLVQIAQFNVTKNIVK